MTSLTMTSRNVDRHLFVLLVLVYSTQQEATPPQATPPLAYHVTEEQARGTLVANLSADARLAPETLSKIRFRFLSESAARLFTMDALSGVIRTGEVIDRDDTALCRSRVTCEWHTWTGEVIDRDDTALCRSRVNCEWHTWTGEVIDRDDTALCRSRVTCVVHLDVALQPLQYFQVGS